MSIALPSLTFVSPPGQRTDASSPIRSAGPDALLTVLTAALLPTASSLIAAVNDALPALTLLARAYVGDRRSP